MNSFCRGPWALCRQRHVSFAPTDNTNRRNATFHAVCCFTSRTYPQVNAVICPPLVIPPKTVSGSKHPVCQGRTRGAPRTVVRGAPHHTLREGNPGYPRGPASGALAAPPSIVPPSEAALPRASSARSVPSSADPVASCSRNCRSSELGAAASCPSMLCAPVPRTADSRPVASGSVAPCPVEEGSPSASV